MKNFKNRFSESTMSSRVESDDGLFKLLPKNFLDLTEDERTIEFEFAYLQHHGRLANPTREAMRKDVFKSIDSNSGDLAAEIRDNLLNIGIKKAVGKATEHALNAAVARAVVASTVKGSIR